MLVSGIMLSTANGLKTKFRELARGASTGGGGRSTFEKEAKDIEHAIDKKAGVIVDGKMLEDIRKDELGRDEKKEESSDPTPPKWTRMAFEKDIIKLMRENDAKAEERQRMREEMANERQREIMELLCAIFIPHHLLTED